MIELMNEGWDAPDSAKPSPFNYSPYLTMFGGGIQAVSQLQAGRQSAALLGANATIAGLQARSENEMGAAQAEMYRQHLESRIGAQAAAIGGANVTASGSALRSLERTASLGAQDIERIKLNAAHRAWGFQTTEQGDLVRAQMAKQQGTMGAIGSLITTGARAYGQWSLD